MIQYKTTGDLSLLRSSITPDNLHADWFEPQYWQEKSAVTGTSQGRNVTYFVEHQQQQMVLRHYYRGGLVARFNKDRYRFESIETTRPFQEMSVLESLHKQGLAVPRPIAGRVIQRGRWYQADILIEKIDAANDVFQLLMNQPLDASCWQRIGQAIGQLHRSGGYHADLNIHNILLDGQKNAWLIDFDRGEIRSPEKQWQRANLDRLKRSLRKEQQKHASFNWHEQDWLPLMRGYEQQP